MLDTVTLVYTQVFVDLTRFQTLDGLRFSYLHPSIVSRQFAVDKVRDSTLVQTFLLLLFLLLLYYYYFEELKYPSLDQLLNIFGEILL